MKTCSVRGLHGIAFGLVLFASAAPLASTQAEARQPRLETKQMNHVLSLGARSLAYTKTGNGPAVVVIHGIGGHKEDWANVAAELAPRHTVYAIDMLGFGGSSKDAEVITIADQVKAVTALLDAEGVKATDLIGNSVGGWVAATFAADHPDRVRKLVLVDAAGFKAMFEGPAPVEFYPKDTAAMSKLLEYVRFDPKTHTADYAEAALKASVASGDAQAAEAVGKGMFVSPRLEDVAARVTAPTLVVWGEEDKLFPPAVADLVAGNVRNAQKVLIPHASHFPQLDNPAAFDAAVSDFLR